MRRLRLILALVLACAGTVRAVEPWRDADCLYRKKITIDNTFVDAALSDFTMLVKIRESDLIDETKIVSKEYTFWDGSGNELDFEQESYTEDDENNPNPSFVELDAWVEVGSIASGATTDIWIYYSHSGGDQDDGTAAWDTDGNWEGVWHLSDTSPFDDATANARHATDDGDDPSAQYTTGLIHYSRTWPGPAGGATLASSVTLEASNCTIESWVRMTNTTAWRAILGDTGNDRGLYLHTGDGKLHVYSDAGNTGSAGAVTLNQWDHIALVYDGSDTLFYINGALDTTAAAFDGRNDVDFLAVDEIDNEGFRGQTDEMRASDTNRSTAWLKFTYHNVNEADNEIAVAAEETPPAVGIPSHLRMRSPHLHGGHL